MIEIDGYHDLARIGTGGLGDVYRATRVSTGSTVAIKVLRDVSDSSVAWHRTRRELTALVALSGHAHVIGLLELLDLPSGPALVMEYAPGGSVAGLLARRGGRLSIGEAVLVGRQTASALVAAHADDIVHRDLKPQNLLIDGFGQVKLCDFGISSLARSEEFRTRTNAWSTRYASPEDLEEDVEVGPPADVYSLGATLLHLVHGAPPTLKERLTPWEPPSVGDPRVDTATIDAILADCLHPEPERRPTAAAVLERLEAIDWTLDERCRALEVVAPTVIAAVGGRPADGPPIAGGDAAPGAIDDDTSSATVVRPDRPAPAPPPRPPATSRRRRRAPWAIAAVCLLFLVPWAIFWLVGDDDPANPTATIPNATSTIETSPTTASTSTAESVSSTAALPSTPAAVAVAITARADGLAPLGDELVWPFGDVGGCLVQANGLDELQPVDCGEPHDLQRFAVAEIGTDAIADGAPFDADAIAALTAAGCRAEFERFVGVDADASEFAIAVTRPSAETWADGDRRFQCLLGVEDAWLVGDAAGSGQ